MKKYIVFILYLFQREYLYSYLYSFVFKISICLKKYPLLVKKFFTQNIAYRRKKIAEMDTTTQNKQGTQHKHRTKQTLRNSKKKVYTEFTHRDDHDDRRRRHHQPRNIHCTRTDTECSRNNPPKQWPIAPQTTRRIHTPTPQHRGK